jgi:geranylgeranyl reductase family protein
MNRCDALIVGGGPAGSTCAWALRHAGLDVLVLDKSPFPRDKVCAGWITPEVVSLLQLDLEDYRHGRTLQPIRRFRTGLLGATMLETDYGETVSYGILRREFDDYLLRRSGARLRLGEALNTFTREDDAWRINGSIETPLLIGAGGHFCPVAKRLNPKNKQKEEIVTAQEMECEMSEAQLAAAGVQGETPELFFLPELDGYGWCVRKGNTLNIGLGRTENRHLADYVARFRDYLVEQGRIPADIAGTFRGHAYRLASQRKQRHVVDDGVLLIGDALGLAYPQSGEGIRTAVESGLLAAEAIIEAHGNYRKEKLQPYTNKLDVQFAGDDKEHAALPLPEWLKRLIARGLMKSRTFSRRVLLDKWFLHRHA